MGWVVLENRKGRSADGVTFALRVDANGQKAVLRLGADTIAAAAAAGLNLAAGQTVAVELGAGSDLGRLRLRNANAGWKLQPAGSKDRATGSTLALAAWDMACDAALAAAPADWSIDDEAVALVVTLPNAAVPKFRATVTA